jgi:hypothetical protein
MTDINPNLRGRRGEVSLFSYYGFLEAERLYTDKRGVSFFMMVLTWRNIKLPTGAVGGMRMF